MIRFKQCLQCQEFYIPRPDKIIIGKFCDKICAKQYQKKENHGSWRGGLIEVICQICNSKYKIPKCRLHTSKYCSRKCQHQSNIGKPSKLKGISRPDISGANNHFWKGGTSSENKKFRMTCKYRQWRENIFIRDNYTCAICHKRGGHLEPHHIKRVKDCPDLVYYINNGITLCKKCHRHKVNGHEKDYESFFQDIVSQKCLMGV